MRALLVMLGLVLLAAPAASGAEWFSVRPGASTQDVVRTQFGPPTKQASQKVEGYDSVQWLYEGNQAPRGMVRATVDFGILTPQGYRADIVRQMMLEPRPGVFTRNTVVAGWGEPDAADVEGGKKVLFYRSGLLVYFDKDGWRAERMYFTPPQPPAGGVPPPRP
jgi:hypothetical protein